MRLKEKTEAILQELSWKTRCTVLTISKDFLIFFFPKNLSKEIFQLGTFVCFWNFYFNFSYTVKQVLWPSLFVSRNFQLMSRNAKSNFRNYMHAHKSIRICWKWQSFLTKFKQFSASVFSIHNFGSFRNIPRFLLLFYR